MSTAPTPFTAIDQALALRSLHEADALATLVGAIREASADAPGYTVANLERLVRVAGHFEALLEREQAMLLRGELAGAERDFALGVRRVYLDAANGLQRYLRNADAWWHEKGSPPIARVVAIAIECVHHFAKWGRFLGESDATWPWRALHALYTLAESQECERDPVALARPRAQGDTTIRALYVRSLLLERLDARGLSHLQLQVADEWLADASAGCELQVDRARAHASYVDLASGEGLRALGSEELPATTRYLLADALAARLQELRAGGAGGGSASNEDEARLGAVERAALLDALAVLQRAVGGGRESRAEERALFSGQEVEVAVGVEAATRLMHQNTAPPAFVLELLEPDGKPQPRIAGEAGVERWRVHDLSTAAFGLVASARQAAACDAGTLLALRNQENRSWILCSVVRKVAQESGDVLVGVEVLAFRSAPAKLARTGNDASEANAIYIPGPDSSGASDTLLLPLASDAASPPLVLRVGAVSYAIRMTRRMRKGADWTLVRFAVESVSIA